VIIGAGGIGSRHLQGVRTVRHPLHVHLIDPSPTSLETARARWDEAPTGSEHHLTTGGDLDSLRGDPTVVIVATTSLVRSSVLHGTLDRVRPRHLVLEKFLFPDPEDYRRANQAVEAAGIHAWVNTARRSWPGYRDLRQELTTDGPVSLHVSAQTAHGVGSNAVHFLDLLTYLTGRPSGPLDATLLHPIVNERRQGSVEFDGAVQGYNAAGDLFSLSTTRGATAPLLVTVTAADAHVVVDETNRHLLHSVADGTWATRPFVSALQSELTGAMVEQLLREDRCDLPSLAEAIPSHLSLLDAYLASYRAHRDPEATACPVT
jgi:predicted dehydrogenase